ncbi:PQQ-like beta-propeller repeat protein [bacterium]|nr:PQQ-like beta-propeller repeat protein [bacterium]
MIRLTFYIVIFIVFVSCDSNNDGKNEISTFSKTFGGPYTDQAYGAVGLDDGTIVIVGHSKLTPSGQFSPYILRITSQGDTVWSKVLGENGTASGVTKSSDGAIVVAFNTNGNLSITKLETHGQLVWQKSFGPYLVGGISSTSDGGFVVCGDYLEDLFLLKTTSSGDSVWFHTYGGGNAEIGNSALQTSDGGFILMGYTRSFGAGMADGYLVKTDANGQFLWQKTYGTTAEDQTWGIKSTSDGGYIITGFSEAAGYASAYVIKTNANGDTLWTRSYPNGGNINTVLETTEGGFLLGGSTRTDGFSYPDMYLVKTTASGDTIWSRSFGGVLDENCTRLISAQDGGYFLIGSTASFGSGEYDINVIKTDNMGLLH